MMNDDHAQRFELAKAIAIEAGKSTLQFFCQDNFEVIKKDDGSPLTKADQTAEKLMRERIEAAFPNDGIVGEEFGIKEGTESVRWILDPIDGTKSFISGVPLYGTMVGIEIDGKANIGVCYFPGLEEGIFARIGSGCFHFKGELDNAKPTRVSEKRSLADGVLVTSDSATFDERDAAGLWKKLESSVYFCRSWGDAYGYMLVATGRVEVMIDPILSIWDAAAVMPIIEEAGGRFTDWKGEPGIEAGEAIGSNGHVHNEVIQLISQQA